MDEIQVTTVEVCLQKQDGFSELTTIRYNKDENVIHLLQGSDEIVLDVNELQVLAREGMLLLEQWNG